jgi:hypothetical protein
MNWPEFTALLLSGACLIGINALLAGQRRHSKAHAAITLRLVRIETKLGINGNMDT